MKYQIVYRNKYFQAYCPKEFYDFKVLNKASYRKSLGCWQFKFNLENFNLIKNLKDFMISDKVRNYFKKQQTQINRAQTRQVGVDPGDNVQLSNGKTISWTKHGEYDQIFCPIFDRFNWSTNEDEKQYLKRIMQEIIGREVTDKEYNRGF